jgi:hypothetical protein
VSKISLGLSAMRRGQDQSRETTSSSAVTRIAPPKKTSPVLGMHRKTRQDVRSSGAGESRERSTRPPARRAALIMMPFE